METTGTTKKCYADKGNECYALKEKQCIGCKFYKEESEKVNIKRIEKLIERYKEKHNATSM